MILWKGILEVEWVGEFNIIEVIMENCIILELLGVKSFGDLCL
jgi:hypothetical protein